MEQTKELQLSFKTSEGKSKTLTIANPVPDLNEDQIKTAMNTIAGAQAFEAEGVALYQEVLGAKYIDRTVTPVFDDRPQA